MRHAFRTGPAEPLPPARAVILRAAAARGPKNLNRQSLFSPDRRYRRAWRIFLLFLLTSVAAAPLTPRAALLGGAPKKPSAAGAAASSNAAPAEILWDTWGVPHIFARDEPNAFRAFGWAQMADHGNLLLLLLARARGRAAEYFGEKELVSDRAARILGLFPLAQKWYAQQAPPFRADLDAFAAGINQYARQYPDKLEAPARAVLPVTGADLMAHMLRVSYGFLAASGGCSEVLPLGASSGPGDGPGGSNGWAIGPAHSADGHAMLLANPHLPWAGETTWEEAQIVAPGYSAYGATLVGFPVLGIAFNEHLGWTHTVNTIDPCDLYELKLSGSGYLFDGRVRAFATQSQTIKVRRDNGLLISERVHLRRAAQGPVVEKNGKVYAIRVAGIQAGSFAGAAAEWWAMGRAQNLDEFQAALRQMQLPMFNVIYADDAGHILLLSDGLVPEMPVGDAAYWSRPAPGDTSANLWTKILPYDALPKAIDPPAGWVQNSNSAPWYMTEPLLDPAHFPPYLSHPFGEISGWPSLREQRGLRMLMREPKISFDRLLHDKFSTRSELADRVLDDLVAAAKSSGDPRAREAAAVLAGWDRRADSESRGGVLFDEWFREIAKSENFFAVSFDPQRLLDTPRGLKDPAAAVAALSRAAQRVQADSGKLDVSWGEVFRFRRGKIDLPANGGPSRLGIFRVVNYNPAEDHRSVAAGGDSFIAAVDFATPLRAKVLLAYGNSGDPASPHYDDQLALAAQKQFRDAWLTRAEIEAHLEARTVFSSSGAAVNILNPHYREMR